MHNYNAKNEIKVMKQYLDLVKHVLDNGTFKGDRTPDFIEVIREVTEEERFKNKFLARID